MCLRTPATAGRIHQERAAPLLLQDPCPASELGVSRAVERDRHREERARQRDRGLLEEVVLRGETRDLSSAALRERCEDHERIEVALVVGDERDAVARGLVAADLDGELQLREADRGPSRDRSQRIERDIGDARVLAESLSHGPTGIGHRRIRERMRLRG